MSYITGMKLTQSDATPLYKEGAIGMDSNGYLYKYLKYKVGAGAIAAVAGNVVGYYAPSGTGAGSLNVTSDVSDTAAITAGALMAAPAADEWSWIKVKGKQTLTTALVSGSEGNALRLSATTDGTLKVAAAVTDSPAGVLLYATGPVVMLDCPL